MHIHQGHGCYASQLPLYQLGLNIMCVVAILAIIVVIRIKVDSKRWRSYWRMQASIVALLHATSGFLSLLLTGFIVICAFVALFNSKQDWHPHPHPDHDAPWN